MDVGTLPNHVKSVYILLAFSSPILITIVARFTTIIFGDFFSVLMVISNSLITVETEHNLKKITQMLLYGLRNLQFS